MSIELAPGLGQYYNRYYLKLAEDWKKEKCGPKDDVLDVLLVNSMKSLGIEHIHYAGNENYNGNPSRHVEVD